MPEDAKGKCPAATREHVEKRHNEPPNLPLLSTVAGSGRAFTRGIFATSVYTRGELNALADTGKGRSSAGGSVQGSGGSGSADPAERSRSHNVDASHDSRSRGLRLGYTAEHIANLESEFTTFLHGIDSAIPLKFSNLETPLQDPRSVDAHRAATSSDIVQYSGMTVGEQERCDGEPVISLLCSQDEVGESDRFLPVLLDARKDICSVSPQTVATCPLNSLNLVPDFNEPVLHNMLNQWENVWSSYTDDVWGEMLPLVRKTRADVKHLKDMSTASQLVALRRLEAILEHMRTKGTPTSMPFPR